MAHPYASDTEKTLSAAAAVLMHVLFFALLVVGVAWQKRETPGMVADLWRDLPAPPVPKAAPPPPKAAPEPPKPAPKPAPKAEPKPPPKVEPKPAPKAEISLKEKKEKERKAKERELAEKKKREEQAAAEKKKREEQARQAKEAEEQRLAREREEALKMLAAQQAAAESKLVDEYKRRIADRIKRFIIEPPNLQGNPEVEFDVVVLPGGEVLDVKTRRGSGQASWDSAVERAIRRAQPLPLPPDPALMGRFRELNLKFRPKE